jgi:putative copper resistance protein D
VAWLLFAAVMWGTHFSPLFDAALESPLLHDFEHALYLVAAVLFWAPAVALDPAPWRMTHPVRALYLFLQMTQNSFLSVVLLNAQTILYPHYATVMRAWGPSALADQQLAAGIMWLAGDLIFLVAIMAIVADWARAERRDTPRADRQAATELAEIRVREERLAARRAREAEDAQSGSGVSR